MAGIGVDDQHEFQQQIYLTVAHRKQRQQQQIKYEEQPIFFMLIFYAGCFLFCPCFPFVDHHRIYLRIPPIFFLSSMSLLLL